MQLQLCTLLRFAKVFLGKLARVSVSTTLRFRHASVTAEVMGSCIWNPQMAFCWIPFPAWAYRMGLSTCPWDHVQLVVVSRNALGTCRFSICATLLVAKAVSLDCLNRLWSPVEQGTVGGITGGIPQRPHSSFILQISCVPNRNNSEGQSVKSASIRGSPAIEQGEPFWVARNVPLLHQWTVSRKRWRLGRHVPLSSSWSLDVM